MAHTKREHLQHQLGQVDVRMAASSKHLRLRVVGYRHLQVSGPRHIRRSEIARFLDKNHRWIEKQQLWRQPLFTSGMNISPETKLHFAGESNPQPGDIVILSTDSHRSTETDSQIKAYDLSIKHLRKLAKEQLPQRAAEMSQQLGLPFNELRLKNLSSRWGSCSNKKNLNLNLQLMRLDENLRDHVIAHELCHTVHLSHSPSFWRLLKERRPDFERERRQLAKAQLWRKPTKH